MNDLAFHSDLSRMAVPVLPNVPLHDAAQLTRGGNLAQIALGDQLYTLRITRAGKLILTK